MHGTECTDDDVAGFQVAVHHATAMRVGDGFGNAQHHFGNAREIESLTALLPTIEQRLQRVAVEAFHNEGGFTQDRHADIMHRHDARMFKLSGDRGFAAESA